ncbi:MAG: hypothetical protein LQ346_005207 [Caloplaca aetnensis]|nr:MAG: hypothetical protein LQ346_005207 [Caloplaca aetnensis]
MALDLGPSQQSQASSTESMTSREHDRQHVSYEDSPSSRSQNLRESTPSTSLSDDSSQERAGSLSSVHASNASNASETGKLHIRSSNSPLHLGQILRSRTINPVDSPPRKSPLKRTASGQVKPGESEHWAPSASVKLHGHSRNTSTASKTSQVSDLSHELRTRLSYAMFKVQNGWQSHNLNELEAMTLPRSSPSSGLSQLQHAAGVPPSSQHSQYPAETSRYAQRSPPAMGSAYEQPALRQVSAQSPPLYHAMPNATSAPHSPHRGPSLAPPVDILPRTSHQLHSLNMQPPQLNTTNTYHNGASNLTSPTVPTPTPLTPTRRPASSIRTPSQKADAEKDAVETLMFMSSPGNSGYHPAAFRASAMSPLRSNGSTRSPTKRTTFASPSMSKAPAGRLATTADIDRVLDEMPDRYSSSDDEE